MNKLSGILFFILIICGDCDNQDNCSVKFILRFNSEYWGCKGAYDVNIGIATTSVKCSDGNFFRTSPVIPSSRDYTFDGFYPDMTYYYKVKKSFNNTCDPVHGLPNDYILTGSFTTANRREKIIAILMP